MTHTIRVEGGSARTTVNIKSPRYWDEGEVWHYFGGWSKSDLKHIRNTSVSRADFEILYRNFPQWHNRNAVATNSYVREEDFKARKKPRKTRLDKYYEFTLGTDAIDYMSNHWNKVDNSQKIERAIKDREPADFDVSPLTLDIREYNRMIAETDEDGKFAPWTLANRFWGDIHPHADPEAKYPIDEALEYNERYGASERELLVEFLDNDPKRTDNGRMVYTGPTFGGDDINPIQKQVLDIIDDLEHRDVGQGTT